MSASLATPKPRVAAGPGQWVRLPRPVGERRQVPAVALPIQAAGVERTAHRVGSGTAALDAPAQRRRGTAERDGGQAACGLVRVVATAVLAVCHGAYEH